jgi:hypothetical protein
MSTIKKVGNLEQKIGDMKKKIKIAKCKKHFWYWLVKMDKHYEKLCYHCGEIKIKRKR